MSSKVKKTKTKLNKFAEWMQANDKKQRGVAKKLGISTSTLHEVLRKGHMPSLILAYKIEQYTKGAVTLYDWADEAVHTEEVNDKRQLNFDAFAQENLK